MVNSLNSDNASFFNYGSEDSGKELNNEKKEYGSNSSSSAEDDEFGVGDELVMAKSAVEENQEAAVENTEGQTAVAHFTQVEVLGQHNLAVSQSTAVLGTETLTRVSQELVELRNEKPILAKMKMVDEQINVIQEQMQVLDEAIHDLHEEKQQIIHLVNYKVILHEGKLVQLHEKNIELAKNWKTHGAFIEPDGKFTFHNQEIIDRIKNNKIKFVNDKGVEQDFDPSNLHQLPPEGEHRNAHLRRFESEHAKLDRLIDVHERLTVLVSKRQHLNNQLTSLRLQRDSLQQQFEDQLREANKHVVAPPGPKVSQSIHKIDNDHGERGSEKPLPKYSFTPSFAKSLEIMAQADRTLAHNWKVLLKEEIAAAEAKHQEIKEIN